MEYRKTTVTNIHHFNWRIFLRTKITRSQAVARIADRTASLQSRLCSN